ncbi:MAG: glycosyltransferase family 1 protein [Saprospiraceae bacterium]|nr:glycosyltransferase family 1 protein [Saprospiraceae bacterium]MBK8778622.1 glycosyltransferase family 1 protein [Saprospiraceae bacterium]
MHTTRTLEIPACGTALVTERNQETQNLFTEDDVLFYSDHYELLYKIDNVYNDKEALKKITNQGMNRVMNGGYDYKSILERILKQIEL